MESRGFAEKGIRADESYRRVGGERYPEEAAVMDLGRIQINGGRVVGCPS